MAAARPSPRGLPSEVQINRPVRMGTAEEARALRCRPARRRKLIPTGRRFLPV